MSSPQFLFADQDALNSVFQTGYTRLDPRWNAFAFHPKPIRDKEVAQLAALCEADPWITHFAGATKPWIRHQAQTPQHKPFWELAKSSPFYEEMLALSASVSLGAAPALRRSISRKAAELLMSISRGLHFLRGPAAQKSRHIAEPLQRGGKSVSERHQLKGGTILIAFGRTNVSSPTPGRR